MIIRYLLGELEEEEEARLEEVLFTDEYNAQLLAVEDDLIEAYARGELTRSQRESFESHFLQMPGRRERVELAQDLARIMAEEERSGWRSLLEWLRTPAARASFATAAGLAVILGGVWLFSNWRARMEAEHAAHQLQARQWREQLTGQRARIEQLESELEQERRLRASPAPSPGRIVVFAFALTPFTGRGGAGEKQTIPSGTNQFRIRLDLEQATPYLSYRAEIKRAGESQTRVETLRNIKPTASGQAVIVTIARSLDEGDYILTLQGKTGGGEFETVAEYQFTISKE